jgi:Protein of unknown function (DUF1236)
MKTHVYLITTAAAALLAGTVFAAAQGMQKQAPSGAAEQSPPKKDQTQPGQKKDQTQPGQRRGEAQGQQQQPQTQGQGQQQRPGEPPAQRSQKEQTQQGKGKQDLQQKSGGSVTFTTEQRTHIRTTVLQGSNAPRATNVNFSINVGRVVPRSMRVVAVPQVMVDVYPKWRGLMYFIVDDQIIIVDRNYKIVAVIDV